MSNLQQRKHNRRVTVSLLMGEAIVLIALWVTPFGIYPMATFTGPEWLLNLLQIARIIITLPTGFMALRHVWKLLRYIFMYGFRNF